MKELNTLKSKNQLKSPISRKNTNASLQDVQSVFNFHKLPAILINNNKYLIYSPFSKEFAVLDEELLNEKSTFDELNNRGFFAKEEPIEKDNRIKVGIITTTACNQNCAYCATCSEFIGDKGINFEDYSIKTEIIEATLDRLMDKYSIEAINFMGGEPTLNMPVIRKVIELMKGKGKRTLFSIQTNGVMGLDNLNYLVDKGIVFSISWDGVDNDKFREASETVKRNILILKERGALFKVRMTVGKWNLGSILESVKWLADNKVKFIQLEPMLPEGRGSELPDQSLSPEEFSDIFFKALGIVEERGCFLINYSLTNLFSPKKFFCDSAAGKKIILNPDGSVSSCYKVQRKTDDLSEHFIIGEYNLEKLGFEKSNFSVEGYSKCDKCSFFYLCSGSCPFENIKSREDVDSFLCKMRGLLLKKGILHLYQCKSERKLCGLEGFHIMGRIAMKRRYDNLPNFMI